MSLEKLLAKIEDDARLEGKRIVAEAKEEATRIKRQGEEEAHGAADEILRSFRERAERERTRIMSEALAESRATFLATQDELYNEVFTAALKQAHSMPEKRYRAWLKRIIVDNTIGGDEEILAAPYDRHLLEDGLLDEVNRALRGEKRKGSLTLSPQEAEFERGVILKGPKIENNLTLRTILRETRDRHEEELLKTLFGEVDVRGGTRGQSS